MRISESTLKDKLSLVDFMFLLIGAMVIPSDNNIRRTSAFVLLVFIRILVLNLYLCRCCPHFTSLVNMLVRVPVSILMSLVPLQCIKHKAL